MTTEHKPKMTLGDILKEAAKQWQTVSLWSGTELIDPQLHKNSKWLHILVDDTMKLDIRVTTTPYHVQISSGTFTMKEEEPPFYWKMLFPVAYDLLHRRVYKKAQELAESLYLHESWIVGLIENPAQLEQTASKWSEEKAKYAETISDARLLYWLNGGDTTKEMHSRLAAILHKRNLQ